MDYSETATLPVRAVRKKMTKQLTGKRDDTSLHSAAREGNMATLKDAVIGAGESEVREVFVKQNQAGETALYVAAEYGYVDMVREMIQYYDVADAGIKGRNGFDALHIAAKQGDLGMCIYFFYLVSVSDFCFVGCEKSHEQCSKLHLFVVCFFLLDFFLLQMLFPDSVYLRLSFAFSSPRIVNCDVTFCVLALPFLLPVPFLLPDSVYKFFCYKKF